MRGNQRLCDTFGAPEGIGIQPRRVALVVEACKRIPQLGVSLNPGGLDVLALDEQFTKPPQPPRGGPHFLGRRRRLCKPGAIEIGHGGLQAVLLGPQFFTQPPGLFLVLLELIELIASQAVHIRRETPERHLPLLPGINGIGQPQRVFQMFTP